MRYLILTYSLTHLIMGVVRFEPLLRPLERALRLAGELLLLHLSSRLRLRLCLLSSRLLYRRLISYRRLLLCVHCLR